MAELTYEDVRRAVQTISSNLQSVIGDIKNSVQTARTDISRLNGNDVQYRLNNIERTLNEISQYMQRVDTNLQSNQPLANTTYHNQRQLQRLEQRMANLEQLSTDMSRYMQAIHDVTLRLHDLYGQAFGRAEP